MQPTRNIVLINVDPPKTQTASGLYIQEDWKSLPPLGEVVAVGPEVTTVAPGDRVIFERYASVILDKSQRLCTEDHILARLTDVEA